MSADAVYRVLLRLYPADFRRRFEDDLQELFRDAHRAAAARGLRARTVFWARIVKDAAVTAVAERFDPSQVSPQRGPLMEGLVHDVRYALRMIARRPALSTIIVLTLALGIGANTAIFSLVNTVLLKPVPYRDPERLVSLREQQIERGVTRPVNPANFFDWRARSTSFEDVGWSRDGMFALTGDGEPESIIGYRFSHNMLTVFGVQPALGRNFTVEEDTAGGAKVVILSDKLWRRRYGADPHILGRTLTLNGEAHTVIGVMSPAFTHPQRAELWTPLAMTAAGKASRTAAVLRLIGRLKPGVSREQARIELTSIYQDLAARYPETNTGMTPVLSELRPAGDAKPLLLILFAGVAFVLLIACANVANLLLADASSRRRDLALRSALGATRYRVIRQMLTESLLLAMAGGALGTLVTWWTKDGLVMLFPANIANINLPLVERIDVGAGVFLFAAAVSVVTGLLFGILPAWNVARSNLQGALKDGERGGSGSRRTHSVLVIAEVALSIVLLAGALLMVQSFYRVQRLQFGFNPDPVMTGRVILPDYRYADAAKRAAFTRDLLPRLEAIPGVESAAILNYLPLSGWSGWQDFTIEGRPPVTGAAAPTAGFQSASEDYFKTMGIAVIAGRTFTPRDDQDAPPVVAVNQTLAQRYWPGQNPIGQRIVVPAESGPKSLEIVGVVGDIRAAGLEEPVEGEMYVPLAQNPSPILGLVLKTRLDPATLAGQLRAAVWSVDREQPVTFVMPLKELASESLAFRRAGMVLAGAFGALALVLAAIGIFGVLSYSVSRRTREIGIRMALGATRTEVASRIMGEGLVMTAVGIGIGVAAALGVSSFLRSVLFEVRPGDPLTYVAVAVILLAVAGMATLIPARRATGVDPLVALRAD